MTTGVQAKVEQEDKPLTRADVERLLREVGSSDKLNLRGRNLKGIDLSSFDLRGANLSHVNLNQAELFRADLSEADLKGANLNEAYLSGTLLTKANLTTATLYKADLTGADLSGANLTGTSLNETYLYATDFSHTTLQATTFGNVDLSIAEGLETIIHRGASTIGIDTITQSKGRIPESFLRKAGVPDIFIDFVRSLVAQPIDYYACFISYSSSDHDFAERLHADLQSKGVRCWFAPEDMKIGDKIRQRIDESIRLYDKLLLVLSEHSIQSQWVMREVEAALEKENREDRAVLFPVRLDNSIFESDQAWAANLRHTRHIGDFTRWKDHDAYMAAFQRLLRDLKATPPPLPQKEAHGSRGERAGLEEWDTQPLAAGSALRIRVVEEPLTAQNLALIISALTELATKYWLIAHNRFADLIEYTQTHNPRFAEEAHAEITRITYNSPMNMDWKVDLSAPSVADALIKTVDGIAQVRKRLEKAELENDAKAQEIKHAEQQADREQHMAALEQEKQQLEIEQRRLEVLEKRLEVQKKGIEYALEIAGKVVDALHPGADPATRAMAIQALLPNLIQLQNGKGLELALPAQLGEVKDP